MDTSPLNILIVEDLALTRLGIRTALRNSQLNCNIVAETGSLEEALEILKQHEDIQLLLLDLMLPDGNGSEIVRHLKSSNSPCRILVISAETNQDTIIRLIDMGIDGFVSKFADEETLETAIHSVCNGFEFFGQDISEIIHAVYISRSPDLSIFTNREIEIMKMCAKGQNVKRIAEELNISTRTVGNPQKQHFQKIRFQKHHRTGQLCL